MKEQKEKIISLSKERQEVSSRLQVWCVSHCVFVSVVFWLRMKISHLFFRSNFQVSHVCHLTSMVSYHMFCWPLQTKNSPAFKFSLLVCYEKHLARYSVNFRTSSICPFSCVHQWPHLRFFSQLEKRLLTFISKSRVQKTSKFLYILNLEKMFTRI